MGRGGETSELDLMSPQRLLPDGLDDERPRRQVFRVLMKSTRSEPNAMSFHLAARAWHKLLQAKLDSGYRWSAYQGSDYGDGERIDVRVKALSRAQAISEVLRVGRALRLPALDADSALAIPLGDLN